jgi:hypothetical protein
MMIRIAKAVAAGVAVAVTALLALGLGGVQIPWLPPDTEITDQEPYSDFIGREYQVAAEVRAHAWNDFPDKAKILSITLMPRQGVRNRFVSYVIPLQRAQKVRILSAWRHFTLFGFDRYYVVSVPGAGLPEGVPIKMRVSSDGVPDPLAYEPISK